MASTNVSFPAIQPPLPTPEIQIRLMSETDGVRKVVTNGLVIQGTALVVGVSTSGRSHLSRRSSSRDGRGA